MAIALDLLTGEADQPLEMAQVTLLQKRVVDIAHAGAPPFQLWVLPRRLPRDMLVGTWAVYFAALNWIKVPAFAALGQFSRTNLLTAAALLPLAVVSTFAGVWLVRRIDGERFYTIIYWLMILVGLILLGEAAL